MVEGRGGQGGGEEKEPQQGHLFVLPILLCYSYTSTRYETAVTLAWDIDSEANEMEARSKSFSQRGQYT